MIYSIHITAKAEHDLESAADYIEFTLLNPQAADDLLNKAEKAINSLSSMPYNHQLTTDPALNALGIRYILIDNYIAFFTIDEGSKTVHILRFLYGKRNWAHILKYE